MIGTVVEDRGPIGYGGQRLLRVEVEVDPADFGDDVLSYEVPEEELRAAEE
jgi:hypothetical protein